MRPALRSFLAAVLAGLAFLPTARAADPTFPNKPIRLMVGYAPGGGGDSVARVMAEHMSRTLGQQIVVENRPGAGTTLAPAAAAAAPPDGYTLALVSEARFGADKVLWRPNVKYDETSFTPISKLARTQIPVTRSSAANNDPTSTPMELPTQPSTSTADSPPDSLNGAMAASGGRNHSQLST